ncbi:RNA polymerase sigma factor [Planctomicrobium sp. SH527]|uniref:RNA polymerase sigma factor n=1 Tax=Planctomicrobium sp. SH527 TaxID=3448123 RepID=UPI003F5BF7A8
MSPKTGHMKKDADHSEQGSIISDTRLVEETRQGNRDAFGVLVQRYEKRLIRVILRFVNDVDVAEDLAQETFIRAYERLDQFDPSRRFSPWLFRIGVNLAMDFHRRRKRRIWSILFSDRKGNQPIDAVVPDPRQQIDLRMEVQLVIERVPEKYRTVLILRDMENFSTSEIAAILNRQEATIRWRLAEARIRFEELWGARQA